MSQRQRFQQSGAVLICVMACLLVSIAIAACAVQVVLRQRRELRTELQVRQTEWLLAAGVQLAIDRLTRSDQYVGEVWQPASLDSRYGSARVTINVAQAAEKDTKSVDVIALLGRSEIEGQTQRSFRLDFPSPPP